MYDLEDVIVLVVTRENEDFGLWKLFLDLPRGFEAVENWHRDVHQYNIRSLLVCKLDGVSSVFRFGDDFEIFIQRKKRCNAMTNDRVIVGDENSNFFVRTQDSIFLANECTQVTNDEKIYGKSQENQLCVDCVVLQLTRWGEEDETTLAVRA